MAKLGVDPDNIRTFYDDRYNNGYMREHKGIDPYRVKSVLREIPIDAKNVLDYGCGQGGWTETLSKKFPEADLCGIDISARAVELARKRYPGHRFFVFDGATTPFEENSFDFIYSYHVLEHVSDIERSVSNISRLLKKGGYLCIVLPCGNKGSFEEMVTRLIRDGKEPSIDGRERFFYEDIGHIRRLKSDELIELFARHGVKPYKEFYAYQFWGAVEWISKSGFDFVRDIFDHKKSVSLSAKARLLLLREIFMILAADMKLYTTKLLSHVRSDEKISRRMAAAALIPFKMLLVPFGYAIDLFSFMEWRFRRTARNGSAQYLIFKK